MTNSGTGSPRDDELLDIEADFLATGDIAEGHASDLLHLIGARNALGAAGTWQDPATELEDRIADQIAAERSGGSSPRRGPSQVSLRMLSAAAVLAVIVAFGAGWFVNAQRNAVAGDAEVALVGGDYAPAASATAELRETVSGIQVELRVDGLPPAPDNGYYQGWFVTSDDVLVTIGTFHLRGDDEPVILWSGLDLADVKMLMVTVQQIDGGSASSGVVALRGPIASN